MQEITISEYGYIGWDKNSIDGDKFIGYRDLEEDEFKELEEYVNENEDTYKIFTRVNPKCYKATSYVGIIQTKSLSIEILPKIYTKETNNSTDELKEKNKENFRSIFTEMLKPLLNINEVQINKADLSVTPNKNIYEMFITMFVKSLDTLIHKGLKSQYIVQEDNQYFLKGKFKFNQHIKENYIHKERFFVEYDEYLPDRVENRLLKSTVKLLLKKTNDYENKRLLRQQLFIFDEVQLSSSHDVDISKINIHRGMEYYEMPLVFAKVFLKHKSFTSLRGKDNVFVLLFPMETVFEKYMEFVLNNSKDDLGIDEVMVNGGKDEYLLSNEKCQMARLQPDYLLKMKGDRKDIVTDAKWKLLETTEYENKDCEKVNISSGDVYQIFSYLHFYDCEDTAYLFVPLIDKESFSRFTYLENINSLIRTEKKRLKIIPINLKNIIKHHKLEKDIFQ